MASQRFFNTAYYISVLRNFPSYKDSKSRKPYIKAKYLNNQKVFLELFIQKITQNKYNTNDKKRRLQYVKDLPSIFSKIKPVSTDNKYIFSWKDIQIIVKRSKDNSLHLLSIYPIK